MPHLTWLPSSSQHSLGSATHASRWRQEGVTMTTVVMEARTRLASHSSLRAMEKAHAVFSSPWPAKSDAGQSEASEEFWRRNEELRLEAYWKEERWLCYRHCRKLRSPQNEQRETKKARTLCWTKTVMSWRWREGRSSGKMGHVDWIAVTEEAWALFERGERPPWSPWPQSLAACPHLPHSISQALGNETTKRRGSTQVAQKKLFLRPYDSKRKGGGGGGGMLGWVFKRSANKPLLWVSQSLDNCLARVQETDLTCTLGTVSRRIWFWSLILESSLLKPAVVTGMPVVMNRLVWVARGWKGL